MTDESTHDVRAALGTLTDDLTPPPALVTGGLARGRRLRTRRRVAAVAGSVTSVAVLALAGAGVNAALRESRVERDAAGRVVVFHGNAAERAFRVAVRPETRGWVCFHVTGPGVPAGESCWEPGPQASSEQAVDLGGGWALAIIGVSRDTPVVTVRDTPGVTIRGTHRVATAAAPGARGWRFAFVPYEGRPQAFVPWEPAR